MGVNKKLIILWVKQYEHNGLDGFMKRYTNYTQKFKLNVLNFMIEKGTSLTETTTIFNLPAPPTILVWREQWNHKESMLFNHRKSGFRS